MACQGEAKARGPAKDWICEWPLDMTRAKKCFNYRHEDGNIQILPGAI
jgi:hypothetical protein